MKQRIVISVVFALALVAAFVAGSDVLGEKEQPTVAPSTQMATSRGVAFAVPGGWKLITLSADHPCAPREPNIVVVAPEGLGGDCQGAKPDDATIAATQVSPLETAPATLARVGTLNGWIRQEPRASFKRWVAVVPDAGLQLTFSGPVDDAVRQQVIDSIRPA